MTKHVRIWFTVYKMLPVLARKMAAEKGQDKITYSDAASQAIIEALAIRSLLSSEIDKGFRIANYNTIVQEYEVMLKN